MAVPAVPAVIGRYRLDRRLGAGGFAVVWLAHDESLDTLIAIKVLADNWSDRMDLRERFLAEARMLRRTASSRVVQVFDIGELPDGRPYFVMEYADRGTLADRVAASPLTLVEALRLTAQVARGVAELHAAGIVHRDLKPSNVLIKSTPEGGERLLVADLGVAKNLAQASGLTMSVGSAGYMAPEQAEPNTGVDVRADVYSLGALGFHLITGRDPGSPGQVLSQQGRAELPSGVRRLLEQALEPRRERRWPDASTFAAQLDRLAGELETPRRRPWSRRAARAVAAVLAVLIGVAVVGLGLLEGRRPVTVHDASGKISVAVPRSWSRELQPNGWNPAALQLSGEQAPGLVIADHATKWNRLDADVNGVFVGVTSDVGLVGAVGAIVHPQCRRLPGRSYRGARWAGTVRRWTDCDGAGRTLEEISLTPAGTGTGKVATTGAGQVYVQIRQAAGRDDTAKVLDDLQVSW